MTKETETEAEATTEEPRHVSTTCCLECDRDLVKFFTKTVFAGAILGFARVMIATDDDPGESPLLSWYTSMIGLVAGSYIEQTTNMNRKPE